MQLLAADTGNDSDEESSASLPDPSDDESGRYAVLARELADLVMLDDRGFLPEESEFYPAVRSAIGAYFNATWNREVWMPIQSLEELNFLHSAASECFELPASSDVSTAEIVNIRSCPGISCGILGVTQPGELMTVQDVQRDDLGRDWYEVRRGGWIAAWLTEQMREFGDEPAIEREVAQSTLVPGCIANQIVVDPVAERTTLAVSIVGDSSISLIKEAVYLEGRYIQLQPAEYAEVEKYEGDRDLHNTWYQDINAPYAYVALASYGYQESIYKLDLRDGGVQAFVVYCS